MRIISDATTVESAQKALINNGHTPNGVGAVSMHSHAYCSAPLHCELAARIGVSVIDRGRADRPRFADLLLPCRKCVSCKEYRHRSFVRAASREIASAQRSWLLTLTMSPESHARYGGMAVPVEDQRKAWVGEIQRYFKRVRKHAGDAKLRLAWVLEHHKSGLFHAHALVHEQCGSRIRVSSLDHCWSHGWVNTRLVADRFENAARYVGKYILKDENATVVVSRLYGRSESIGDTREKVAGELLPPTPPLSLVMHSMQAKEALSMDRF